MVQLSYYFNIIKTKYYTKKYNVLINIILKKKYLLLKNYYKIYKNYTYYNIDYDNYKILNIKNHIEYIKKKLKLYKYIINYSINNKIITNNHINLIDFNLYKYENLIKLKLNNDFNKININIIKNLYLHYFYILHL